jgi:hypothetical protein
MLYVKFPMQTKHLFFNPSGPTGEPYRFSSDLEKIGSAWDVSIRNGTRVEVISDPVDISRPQYGGIISVVKVRADVADDYHTIIKEFWVPTICVIELENNETRSTQLAN